MNNSQADAIMEAIIESRRTSRLLSLASGATEVSAAAAADDAALAECFDLIRALTA